jgi:hypothetical protein
MPRRYVIDAHELHVLLFLALLSLPIALGVNLLLFGGKDGWPVMHVGPDDLLDVLPMTLLGIVCVLGWEVWSACELEEDAPPSEPAKMPEPAPISPDPTEDLSEPPPPLTIKRKEVH